MESKLKKKKKKRKNQIKLRNLNCYVNVMKIFWTSCNWCIIFFLSYCKGRTITKSKIIKRVFLLKTNILSNKICTVWTNMKGFWYKIIYHQTKCIKTSCSKVPVPPTLKYCCTNLHCLAKTHIWRIFLIRILHYLLLSTRGSPSTTCGMCTAVWEPPEQQAPSVLVKSEVASINQCCLTWNNTIWVQCFFFSFSF